MSKLGTSTRVLIGVALLVGGLLAAAAPASAGTSWGTGCGGQYAWTDSCNFISPTGTTVAGSAEVHTMSTVVPPTWMATFLISLDVIGPDGTQRNVCATHMPTLAAAACTGTLDIPANWVGQPLTCVVTAIRVSGFQFGVPSGTYVCQAV